MVNRVDRHGELVAPSSREVRVQGGQGLGVAFWDAGSSVHLVRKKFAEEAGGPGNETVLSLQMTGGQPGLVHQGLPSEAD